MLENDNTASRLNRISESEFDLLVKAQKWEARDEMPDVWANLLDPFDWSLFATLTFRDYPHPESAGKVYDNFIHFINRQSYCNKYWQKKEQGIFWAKGTEYQSRGSIHFHALLGGVPEHLKLSTLRDWWYSRGGIHQIERFERGRGAAWYMSKSAYAWKRGEIDMSSTLIHEKEGTRIDAVDYHRSFVKTRSRNLESYSF